MASPKWILYHQKNSSMLSYPLKVEENWLFRFAVPVWNNNKQNWCSIAYGPVLTPIKNASSAVRGVHLKSVEPCKKGTELWKFMKSGIFPKTSVSKDCLLGMWIHGWKRNKNQAGGHPMYAPWKNCRVTLTTMKCMKVSKWNQEKLWRMQPNVH